MTSLIAEEKSLKKYLKSFYTENQKAQQQIEESFDAGITEMEQKKGNLSFTSFMVNMNFREKSDIESATIQGRAIGLFTRGLKYKEFWESMFNQKLNVRTIMSNLRTRGLNTEFFTAIAEHWKAKNLRNDFNKPGTNYTQSMEQIDGIIALFR